ncbi:MAG: thiol:disulfide interchange protein DsbA/DsbL [Proteobacteria bacterium]|nr:thiol:disulfide interchange protein DsbA/DsbL [Pseudomonadota bacterium]
MSSRKALLAVPLLFLAATALSAPAAIVEGTDYRSIATPQPTSTPGRIEVIEFFSYACPHCNEFYPLISAWAAKLPHDVAFKRVPVGFGRPQWVALARAYYALTASGDLERLDGALFHALHEEQKPLFDAASLSEWVGQNGGHPDRFSAAYTSFGVNNQTVQGDHMVETYGIEAVPRLAIDGRYIALGNSFTAMLDNADALIAKVRAENKAAHPH